MNIQRIFRSSFLLFLVVSLGVQNGPAQVGETALLTVQPEDTYQTVAGFGAALAYYEGWLNAHPNKAEIYQAIFGELSLDILRVRNAYDYDPAMVDRVQEYVIASESVLGHPISVMSSSWGPPGYLKNTGDRKNGGTLRYTIEGGSVKFDYAGFAQWWDRSLDEYNAHGIYPDYITMQNEPNWSASWETCLFNPTERITATDTIAGYNKALDAVYDTLMTRDRKPAILSPETVGIGYNNVENYVNALDISKLDGIAHHLYHGVNENNPYASTDFTKVGNFHPEIPHYQTEFSRGDWFALAGLIYKSFYDEKVVAYLYWDLIWIEGEGLVTLDFPWDRDRWIYPDGYLKTKEFYAFKQFSAFIHPGWKMAGHTLTGNNGVALTFVNPASDSAACVVINRSATDNLTVRLGIPGYRISGSSIHTTSGTENCTPKGALVDSVLTLAPHSITTLDLQIEAYDPLLDSVPPTVPDSLWVTGVTDQAVYIAWTPSTDSIGVKGYRIFLDQVPVGITTGTGYSISGLDPRTTYEISVSAYDDAGNESAPTDPVAATTLYFDTDPPVLEATDSIYAEGTVMATSSEDGTIYLVPSGTGSTLDTIRAATIDSVSATAGVAVEIYISGLENGTYWLFATDSAENISLPEEITVLGVGVDLHSIRPLKLFPNPFSRNTTLEFTLNEGRQMQLILLDSQGREVSYETLGSFTPGSHRVILQRNGLDEGLYLFRLVDSRGEGWAGRLIIRD